MNTLSSYGEVVNSTLQEALSHKTVEDTRSAVVGSTFKGHDE